MGTRLSAHSVLPLGVDTTAIAPTDLALKTRLKKNLDQPTSTVGTCVKRQIHILLDNRCLKAIRTVMERQRSLQTMTARRRPTHTSIRTKQLPQDRMTIANPPTPVHKTVPMINYTISASLTSTTFSTTTHDSISLLLVNLSMSLTRLAIHMGQMRCRVRPCMATSMDHPALGPRSP